MKRISAFVMALLCLALCGCGSTAESIDETETEHITTTEVTWCTTIPIDLLEEWEQKKTAEETESDSVTDCNYDTAVSEMQNVESMDIEQLPTERAEQIKADYAEYIADKFGNLTADDIEIRNYLGSYGGYDYLVLYPEDTFITYNIKVITLGDTDILLPSGSLDILAYSEYGFEDHNEAKFIDIETAYADGYLDQNAAEQIKNILENN